MSAASFLSYGGVLKVVRADGSTLNNANARRDGATDTSLKIKNYDDYTLNYAGVGQTFGLAAKTPGSWSNTLKICVIDDFADQTLLVTSGSGIAVGQGATVALTNQTIVGEGTTESASASATFCFTYFALISAWITCYLSLSDTGSPTT